MLYLGLAGGYCVAAWAVAYYYFRPSSKGCGLDALAALATVAAPILPLVFIAAFFVKFGSKIRDVAKHGWPF